MGVCVLASPWLQGRKKERKKKHTHTQTLGLYSTCIYPSLTLFFKFFKFFLGAEERDLSSFWFKMLRGGDCGSAPPPPPLLCPTSPTTQKLFHFFLFFLSVLGFSGQENVVVSGSEVEMAIYPVSLLVGHFSLLGRYSICVFGTVGVGDGE